jgi:hypothetical protein
LLACFLAARAEPIPRWDLVELRRQAVQVVPLVALIAQEHFSVVVLPRAYLARGVVVQGGVFAVFSVMRATVIRCSRCILP